MKRFLKWTLLGGLSLLVLMVAMIALIAATETGTRLAWNLVSGFMPDELKVTAVEGRLFGPLVVRGIDYRAREFRLRVREGELRWSPRDLLSDRTLTVALVKLDGVRYSQLRTAPQPPSKEKSVPLDLPKAIDLPLNVRFREFLLQDLEYRPARDVKPWVLRSASLSAAYVDSFLNVDRLEIDAPRLELDGRARIDMSGAYPLKAAFGWEARPPDYSPASGRTVLTGTLRHGLKLVQTLGPPYTARAQVVISEPLKTPAFDARLNLDSIELRAIDKTLPPLTLSARARAGGTPQHVKLRARASVHEPQHGTLNLALNGGFAAQRVTIDKLTLSSPEQPARLSAGGTVALRGKQPAIDVEGRWRALRWPLTGKAQVESSRGQVTAHGTIDDLHAKLSAALTGSVLSNADIPNKQQIKASFAGGFDDRIVTVKQLALDLVESGAELTADGRVAFEEQPAIELNVEWQKLRWPLVGEARVASPKGSLAVEGPLGDVRAQLSATLKGSAFARADSEQDQTFTLDFDGGFKKQALIVERLAAALNEQRLSVQGRIDLHGTEPSVNVQARWRELRWPVAGAPMVTSPTGEVAVHGTPENLHAKVDINVGEEGGIEGNASRAGENIDLALDWRRLQWPLTKPRVTSESGSLAVSGLVEDYQVKLDTRVNAPELTGAVIDLAGRGSLEALDLARVNVKALNGEIGGRMRVAWKPALQAIVALDAQGLNPGEVLAQWPGKLGLQIRAEAAMRGNRLFARIDDLNVQGRLREYPLKLEARGAYDAQGLELETLDIASGESYLQAQGRIGETLGLNWRAKSPDLAQLLPGATGEISGEGSTRGPLQRPRVQASLTGNGLRYLTFQLEHLNLDADVDVSGEARSELTLDLNDGRVGEIALKQIAFQVEGTPAAHALTLTARTSTGNADVMLNGNLDELWQPGQRWRFELDEATLKYPQLAAWYLTAPITGILSAKRAVLSRGCWASGNARMCGQGDRTPTGVRGVLEIDDLAFAYFRRFLPPDTRIHGSLDARAEFNQLAQGRATAKLRVQTTAGHLAKMVNARAATLEIGARAAPITERVQASNLLEFRPSAIRFNMSERGLRFGAALRLAQGGNIKITADVPDNSEPLTRRPLRGHIDANLPDLSFISRLAPDVGRFEGRLQGDMRLSGSLRAPALHGRLAMTDGFAALYGLGLRLNDISLALVGQGSDALKLTANTHSGGGRLDVDGQLRWAGKNTPRAQFSIEGHEFLAINTMDARVFVSPDLEIEGRMGRVNVTGQLHVPRANITPKELPESAISVSADQVILPPGDEDEQAPEIAGLEVSARVRLILGDEVVDEIGEQITDKLDQPGVYIDAFGLTADIAGELLIIEEPGEPTRGSGELNIVDGRYEAYGQDLIIETGRILFPGGPISEPGVDVRAVRGDLEDADVVVGAQVRGSLKSPKFELFSEPSMSQQEQLSYLVLGRAPGASSGGESSLLARAALALGLKGGNYLAENLGSRLGVDEIGFESSERGTGDGEQASLVIGKYLSPKLYISYGIGLLEPVSTVRLEYSITKSLELVTESSGTQTGGDLIYTIERGQ